MEYNSENYALTLKEDKHLLENLIRYLHPRREDRILEIGCSRGFFTRRIQELSPDTQGIDINPEAIKNGVARSLRVMDAANLEFEDSSFDKIYSCHTIEHVPDIERVLKEMARVLRPGGKIVLVYPAEPFRGLFAMRSAWVLFRNPFRAREIHVRRLTPKTLENMIEPLKLEHVESKFFLFKTPQYFTVLQKRLSS